VARQLASLGSSGGLGGAITPLEHTNSNVTSSSSSCTSTSASSDAAGSSGTTAPVDDTTSTSYRRGFGAKVALPATDVLQMPLVETPATIRFRAYHVGAARVLSRVCACLPACVRVRFCNTCSIASAVSRLCSHTAAAAP
jgi:hypothetical protein